MRLCVTCRIREEGNFKISLSQTVRFDISVIANVMRFIFNCKSHVLIIIRRRKIVIYSRNLLLSEA